MRNENLGSPKFYKSDMQEKKELPTAIQPVTEQSWDHFCREIDIMAKLGSCTCVNRINCESNILWWMESYKVGPGVVLHGTTVYVALIASWIGIQAWE